MRFALVFMAMTFPALMASDVWIVHPGINCYPNHGGTLISSDIPLQGQSLTSCQAACSAAPGCNAFVVRVDGQQQGYCWLRASVNVLQCEGSTGKFDTYTKGQAPPSGRLGTFFALGDWGYDNATHGDVEAGCQGAIAQRMEQLRQEMGDVKFVVNVGDSFYPGGVGFYPNDPQWGTKWLDVYSPGLTGLPWFSVYGNHDYQGRDTCACSMNLSGCAQVHASGLKGWTMPAMSYYDDRFLEDLNIEVIGLDLNSLDALDSGSISRLCQYTKCASQCPDVVDQRKNEALALLSTRMSQSTAKNLIVFSHYPTDYVTRAGYTGMMRQLRDEKRKVVYFGGHRHNVDQNSDNIFPNVEWVVGGGGGWSCDGPDQGFVVGEIYADRIESYPVLVDSDLCCPASLNQTLIRKRLL